MRIFKLTLIALAAIIAWSASAWAITVTKQRQLPGDPQDVWEIFGDFCAIKDWHPAVTDCQEVKEGGATYRNLTLKGGGKIKEKLTGTEDTSYSYEIVESPLPVKNYKATLSVEEDEDSPHRSEVEWEATFDANGVSDEKAEKAVADILEAGVKCIKKQALAAYYAKHGNGGDDSDDGDRD
jgi:Polyketide cyclase / dehydrase and lipid transport